MRISFSQGTRWLLTILMLMYIGQSVASVSVPCHLLSQEGVSQEGALAAEHQHHNHTADHSAHVGAGLPATDVGPDGDREQGSLLQGVQSDSAKTALHDCCDVVNHCTSGSCSMSSLDEDELHALLNAGGEALAGATDKSPSRLANSLYRPPILL